MRATTSKNLIQEILTPAGITLNGDNPWDIRVGDERFYQRVMRDGSMGLGESYMDGWWECGDLAEFFCRIIPSDPEKRLKKNWKALFLIAQSMILNPSRKTKAFEIGEKHYDKGNELYRNMLDKRMVYSCAYWKNARTLDDAQEAKLDLICRKVGLRPGHRVLDIGCGWGSFAKYAAEKYGVEVVGITVSKEQLALGKELCAGLPIEIRLQDYRDVEGRFDHIVSVGMFEHVGYHNHLTYMKTVHRCLKDEGLFLLHTIGTGQSQVIADLWTDKYIFPNSIAPSIKQISVSMEGYFVIEDLHNFGSHYDATLCCWLHNFERNWDRLKDMFDERFYRMWTYYLGLFAGSFRSRHLHVWQIVLSKNGVPGGYCSVR